MTTISQDASRILDKICANIDRGAAKEPMDPRHCNVMRICNRLWEFEELFTASESALKRAVKEWKERQSNGTL